MPEDIKGIFLEIKFWKSKWLLCGIYHPPSYNDQYFFNNIDKALDIYCSYEKFVLAGDFTAQVGESLHDTFLYQHELLSIYENPSCYENLNNLINIDLNLTNCLKSIFKTDTIFTILSDFHKLVLSVFKTTFTKPKPKEVVFKNYRKFNENNFNQDLHNQLSSEQPKDYASFEKIFFINLRKTCTSKEKVATCKPCTVCYESA